MDHEWNDSQPIYRQLRDRVMAMILDGVLKEGDLLKIDTACKLNGWCADAAISIAVGELRPEWKRLLKVGANDSAVGLPTQVFSSWAYCA